MRSIFTYQESAFLINKNTSTKRRRFILKLFYNFINPFTKSQWNCFILFLDLFYTGTGSHLPLYE